GDITSMMDVHIQQDVPIVVPDSSYSIIHESIKSQVPSIVNKYLRSSLPDAFRTELHANNAALKKELSELNYKEVIKESVKAHVVKEVKKFMPQFLPKAFLPKALSDFAKPMLQDEIAKSPISLAQSSSLHQSATEGAKSLSELELKHIVYDKMLKSGSSCSHQTHEELLNILTWSIKLNESKSTQSTKPDQILKKCDRGDDDQDEDPSARSNQGKEMKKRRTRKETESSKKSSTPKESTKGKPTSKPSKSGKYRFANDTIEETVIEIGSDDVDQTFKKKADASEQPSPDANTEQPSPDVAANPNRQKNDWYKKSPSLEPQDPDWNTVKKINDAQEQLWFKEKVNVAVPPLTFDELMSTPIDFPAFAMNCLGLTTLTREVLVGPVFNLLKGYGRPDMSKPLPLIEKEGRLIIPVEIFFSNDLEYLKRDKAERTYSSSITKMPAARSQRQQFYRAMINKTSKHKVFSKLRILSVISVTVDKKWGYGYLKEIVVKRADQKHYTFKECDFSALHLSDIEDMLLLIAQQKINNLDGDVIVDFVSALKMFTRSIVVQNRVGDIQLGVESYQRKLNLLKPQRTCPDITRKELLQNLSLGFNPKSDMPNRSWKTKDQDRTTIILKKIDDVLLKRRIMRSLEVLNRRDLPRNIPLDRIEVLRYDTKGVNVRMGIMCTKTKLTLEQTQQGVSDEVLVSLLSSSGNGSFKALISSSSYLQKREWLLQGVDKLFFIPAERGSRELDVSRVRRGVGGSACVSLSQRGGSGQMRWKSCREISTLVDTGKPLSILDGVFVAVKDDIDFYPHPFNEEACEKWRLRETKVIVTVIWLKRSNRVAARISPGRMKEALGDCITAKNIDPDFLKAQVRATYFYLAMGEIENSKKRRPMCLQSGIDNCVDRKLIAHGSEGPEKALIPWDDHVLIVCVLLAKIYRN
ncbi:integrase, catalytic region, zinc finger, CCHC-type containing protein, partial [Tanacetum coccineum]